jgi:hypothetical protein
VPWHKLDKEFFKAAFADGKKVLGDSTLSELKAYGSSGEKPVFMIVIKYTPGSWETRRFS